MKEEFETEIETEFSNLASDQKNDIDDELLIIDNFSSLVRISIYCNNRKTENLEMKWKFNKNLEKEQENKDISNKMQGDWCRA